MALVERLMGLAADGVTPDHTNKISAHDFYAAGHEMIAGQLTAAQIKTALALDAEAATEFDALIALAPTGTTALATAQKAMFVNSVHAKFLLAEKRYQGYHTPAAVRGKLGL